MAAKSTDSDIDYSKSTGAYPMHDEASVNTFTERAVEHVGSDTVDVQFTTPGPISNGMAEHVAAQRSDLGLSADPSGESDAGYEARPSTVPVPGAEAKVIESPKKAAPRKATQAEGK